MTTSRAPDPRYFYTDPLAAAWMAKHFGMRFCDRTGLSVSADPAMWYMADRHYMAGSLFISPDSLHLLTPQVGDVALYSVPHKDAGQIHEYGPYIHPEAQHHLTIKKILERSGIAFHWPEQEAA